LAERIEEPEAEAAPGAPDLSAAAALAVGLKRSRTKGAADPDAKLDAFLEEQTDLVRIQKEHLHEQRSVILSRLLLGRWKDRVSLVLQAMTTVVGLAVAAAIGVMAWQAHEEHGLTIAAFSVPPDLAARGLTGQVVAARVLDRLSELQNQTVSVRPASTYADNWGDDIKVEIPETGVSIGELNRYLRQWLGRETRVSGEVVRTPTGLSVTARAGTQPGRSFSGSEADMDALISQAAEAIYASTQPYRYAEYLTSHGRQAEGLAAVEWLARHGPPEDQPWAYGGWSAGLLQRGDFEGAARVVREGQARGLPLYDSGALNYLSIAENALGRFDGLAAARRVRGEIKRTGRGFSGLSREAALRNIDGVIDNHLGDYRSAIALWRRPPDLEIEGRQGAVQVTYLLARALMSDHDVSAGLRLSYPSSMGVLSGRGLSFGADADGMRAAGMLRDWPTFAAIGEKVFANFSADPRTRQVAFRDAAAALALGYARVGRLADARAMLAKTLLDCRSCLADRGWVAEIAGDHAEADRWFAALEHADSVDPFADAEWGAAMLERGDADGAIAKLKQAHRKGPHFADPLETWGEALMAKRDYAGAVARFAEADKDAPRWGRNHLMWGEALMLSGRYAEARRQFEAANGMDLGRPDRAALDVLLTRTATGPLHG
jgi:tetratricopeptide (TPR) repeat protein